jgi:hypothetical protein
MFQVQWIFCNILLLIPSRHFYQNEIAKRARSKKNAFDGNANVKMDVSSEKNG